MSRLRRPIVTIPLVFAALIFAASLQAMRSIAHVSTDPDAASPLFRSQLDEKLRDMSGIKPAVVQRETAPKQALIFVSEGVSACIGSGCVASACGGSGCGGSGCAGSACPGSVCGGSACAGSICGGSACGGSVCGGSACGVSGCVGSLCSQSACAGSLCGQSACAGSLCSHCPSTTAGFLPFCPLQGDGSFSNAAGRIAALNVSPRGGENVIRWIATEGQVQSFRLFRAERKGARFSLVAAGLQQPERLMEINDPHARNGAVYRLEIGDDAGRHLTVPVASSTM